MTPAGGGVRGTDPRTSHIAAESLSKEDIARLHGEILHALMTARTGLITHEMAENTTIAWGSITPRMRALVERGLVYNTGLTRPWHGSPGNPPSTRPSIVWQLVALAHIPCPGDPAKPKKPRKPR